MQRIRLANPLLFKQRNIRAYQALFMQLPDKASNMNLFTNRKALLFITCMLGLLSVSFAQQKTVSYAIINKNDSVGNMQATQKIAGDDIVYNLSSITEIKFIMTIKIILLEESRFHNDKLISSSSKRTVNEKLRGSKQTTAVNEGYVIINDGKESKLNQKSIGYNFSKLYFKEPVAISQIYSDYFQKMLSIKTVRNHVYKIDLPESGSNTYYYENGICSKIEIRNTLYNVQMILNK